MKYNKLSKKVLPCFFLFLTIWISAQLLLVYHFGWVNFKKDFSQAMQDRDIVLFNGVKNLEINPGITLLRLKDHTVVFEISNIKTTLGFETIDWSSHYSWGKFEPQNVTRTIIYN